MRKRGIVLGGGAAGIAKRSGPALQVEILARRGLGRSAQVAVVRAGGRTMVLGVTEQHVTMLGEADLDLEEISVLPDGVQGTDSPGTADGRFSSPWKMMLDTVRDKTVRR